MRAVTIPSGDSARQAQGDPNLVSAELYATAHTPQHLFAPGDTATLDGMVDHPELNGREVTITNCRVSSTEYGRAYYITGVGDLLNWVYENRLK